MNIAGLISVLLASFLAQAALAAEKFIPEPVPVQTPILVGAHNCPLWEADKFQMWDNVVKHPERTPALGFYAQENPEVADWETKWAVEHCVSFFLYCWYRTSQGGPVKMQFGSALHEAFFKSRFVGKMKFSIMWENQARGRAGIADERDMLENLLPFWLQNYFKHPSYLKIDGRPLLFIYRPELLIQDLGSKEAVARLFERMRQACRAAGFEGLYLLGEYRGVDPNVMQMMKQLGLDYTFAYCWHVPNSPAPQQAIEAQMRYIKKTQELGILPQVVTVSQGWSGWRDEGSIWKLPPADFERLLRFAKEFVGTIPTNQLGSKLLLLDNWNEWGEGHYLAPHREYGFGYLDAVKNVFAQNADPHQDILPQDIGLGPYDTVYQKWKREQEETKALVSKVVRKGNVTEEDLMGWWAFDEEADAPMTWDYSGHGLGGKIVNTTRAAGIDGKALVCDGGCVLVQNNPLLCPTGAISITCWVETGVAGQDNKWFVNRVFGGSTSTGYRLGVLGGKPCFEIPLTDWSHHLQADTALPTGRWAQIAGTFDGLTMRIYVDGAERGRMSRPGPVMPNQFNLCLGNYEEGHQAYFKGLLDEVKVYGRAMSADEVRASYRAWQWKLK